MMLSQSWSFGQTIADTSHWPKVVCWAKTFSKSSFSSQHSRTLFVLWKNVILYASNLLAKLDIL